MSFMKPRMSTMLPVCAAALLLAATLAPSAGASPFDPSGVLRVVKPAHAQLNANQSSNWFGYDQGSLEQVGKLLTSVAADWTVPAATQHTAGHAGSAAAGLG